jgi:hypothetical protein
MSSDDWPNVDFHDPASIARFEEFAERRKDILLEINATYYERGTAYANLLVLAGYVGAFSIWAFVKDVALSKVGSAAVGTLLGLSLLVFVGFEIYKMIDGSLRAQRVGKLFRARMPTLEMLNAVAALRGDERRRNIAILNGIWLGNVLAALLFSASAILLLFYAMLAVPLGWPEWP